MERNEVKVEPAVLHSQLDCEVESVGHALAACHLVRDTLRIRSAQRCAPPPQHPCRSTAGAGNTRPELDLDDRLRGPQRRQARASGRRQETMQRQRQRRRGPSGTTAHREGMWSERAFEVHTRANKNMTSYCESQELTGSPRKI